MGAKFLCGELLIQDSLEARLLDFEYFFLFWLLEFLGIIFSVLLAAVLAK